MKLTLKPYVPGSITQLGSSMLMQISPKGCIDSASTYLSVLLVQEYIANVTDDWCFSIGKKSCVTSCKVTQKIGSCAGRLATCWACRYVSSYNLHIHEDQHQTHIMNA